MEAVYFVTPSSQIMAIAVDKIVILLNWLFQLMDFQRLKAEKVLNI